MRDAYAGPPREDVERAIAERPAVRRMLGYERDRYDGLSERLDRMLRRYLDRPERIDPADVLELLHEVICAGKWRVHEFGVDRFGELRSSRLVLLAKIYDRIHAQFADERSHDVGHVSRRETLQGVSIGGESRVVSTMTASDEILARNIRDARIAAGLTQPGLGEAIGVSRFRVSDYEHGRYSPTRERVEAIATATGKTPGWFYDEHDGAESE